MRVCVGDVARAQPHTVAPQCREHERRIVAPTVEQIALGEPAELVGRRGVVAVGVGHEAGDGLIVDRVVVDRLGDEIGELVDQVGEVRRLEHRHLQQHPCHDPPSRPVAHRP